jgi:nitrilase
VFASSNHVVGMYELDGAPDLLCAGGSAIYGPDGACLAGPLFGEEGVLHSALDLREIPRQKFEFDPVGHYARADVFRLEVDERPRQAVEYRTSDVDPQ